MIINDIEYLGINGIPINKIPANACEKNMGGWRIKRPSVDSHKCVKCGKCYVYCPDVAVKLVGGWPVINLSLCKGCGICAQECPTDAIGMVKE